MNRRLLLLGAAATFIAFAAYGSFVPLRLRNVPFEYAVDVFLAMPIRPIRRVSRSDLLTNILLFVPIGFFLLGAVANRSRTLAAVWLVPVMLVCAAISCGIEFGQIFIRGRTPSWNDILAQIAGTAIGSVLWLAAGTFVIDWLGEARRSQSMADRLFRVLGAYTALWLVLGFLPFDYTVRPQELAEKFRAGRILLVPFNDRDTLADMAGTLLMAVPIGVFFYLLARHRRVERHGLFAVVLGFSATLLVEFAQLLAVSRIADVTDVLLNGTGTSLGVWLATRQAGDRGKGLDGVRLWPLVGLAAWCVLLAARHWAPFDFVADGTFIRDRWRLLTRVPFHSYYWGMPIFAFAEAASKFLLGLPVGALLQWVWLPRSTTWRRVQAIAIAVVSATIFLAIELGQLMVPSRTPDQTDIYIGTAGAIAGVVLVRLVVLPRLRHPVARE
jgi:glycopeptide antibiotics resistance protein